MAATAETPAALLEPAWSHPGSLPTEMEPQPTRLLFPRGLTICARICCGPDALPEGGLELVRFGDIPNGWSFMAPSSGSAAVAFESGERDPPQNLEGSQTEGEGEASPEAVPVVGPHDVGKTPLNDGVWHHIALSCGDGEARAYIDGKLDGEVRLVLRQAPSRSSLNFGALGSISVEDLQIYTMCLSGVQVAGLAEGSQALPTGLTLEVTEKALGDYWLLAESAANSDQAAEALNALKSSMGLGKDPSKSFQDTVLWDFYSEFLEHGRQTCLSARKAAVFLAILRRLFEVMHGRSLTSVRVGEPQNVSEVFLEYKRLVMAHTFIGDKDGASGLGVFCLPDVRQLTEFLTGTLFEHFVLYQSVLVCPQETCMKHVEVSLRGPREPPVLSKAKLRN